MPTCSCFGRKHISITFLLLAPINPAIPIPIGTCVVYTSERYSKYAKCLKLYRKQSNK